MPLIKILVLYCGLVGLALASQSELCLQTHWLEISRESDYDREFENWEKQNPSLAIGFLWDKKAKTIQFFTPKKLGFSSFYHFLRQRNVVQGLDLNWLAPFSDELELKGEKGIFDVLFTPIQSKASGKVLARLKMRGDKPKSGRLMWGLGPKFVNSKMGTNPDMEGGFTCAPTKKNELSSLFLKKKSFFLPRHFARVKLHDLNRDGLADVVYAQKNGFVGACLSEGQMVDFKKCFKGNGSKVLLDAGSEFGDFEITDFNGDGLQDFLVSKANRLDFALYMGGENLRFSDALSVFPEKYDFHHAGRMHPVAQIVIDDLDGDGLLDMIALHKSFNQYIGTTQKAAHPSLLHIFSGKLNTHGDFYLQANQGHPLGVESYLRNFHLALNDLNRDGHKDILLLDPVKQRLRIHLADKKGQFNFKDASHAYFAGHFRMAVNKKLVMADLDRDGLDDALVFSQNYPNIMAMKSLGKRGLIGLPGHQFPLIPHDNSQERFFTNPLSGWKKVLIENENFDLARVIERDFNGDGHNDLGFELLTVPPGRKINEMKTYRQSKFVLYNGGQEILKKYTKPPFQFSIAATKDIKWASVGDFNGDGNLDILAVIDHPYHRASYGLWRGRGDGSFLPPVEWGLPQFPVNSGPENEGDINLVDVDGDGKKDLVAIGVARQENIKVMGFEQLTIYTQRP